MKHYQIIRLLLFFLAAACISPFLSCQAEIAEAGEQMPAKDQCRVMLILEVPGTEMNAVRTVNDSRIDNINLWLYETGTGLKQHLFRGAGSQNVSVTLPCGTWKIYAVANLGTDAGQMEESSLQELCWPVRVSEPTGTDLPLMAATATLVVTGHSDISATIKLSRTVARLEFDLAVSDAFSQTFVLEKVQVKNAASEVALFGNNHPLSCNDYPAQSLSGKGFTAVFYLPENLAGTVGTISDPRQKSQSNAPQNATYLRIEGTNNARRVVYHIYPGENTTTDFNLFRNRRYVLKATILGIEAIDTRVSVTEVTLDAPNEYTAVDYAARSNLTIGCTNDPSNTFSLRCTFPLGNFGTLQVGDKIVTAGMDVPLTAGTYPVSYTQPTTGRQRIEFQVSDRYGSTWQQEFSTTFMIPSSLGIIIDPDIAIVKRTGYFRILLHETNYTGPVWVTFNEISGAGTLLYHKEPLKTGSVLQLTTGSFEFEYRIVGYKPLTVDVTARDCFGQEDRQKETYTIPRV